MGYAIPRLGDASPEMGTTTPRCRTAERAMMAQLTTSRALPGRPTKTGSSLP